MKELNTEENFLIFSKLHTQDNFGFKCLQVIWKHQKRQELAYSSCNFAETNRKNFTNFDSELGFTIWIHKLANFLRFATF